MPGTVCEAIRSGERTGRMGAVLSSIADYMDEDNELVVKTLMGIVEPIILIGLGVVIALLSASMFLPLFDLTSATGPASRAGTIRAAIGGDRVRSSNCEFDDARMRT